MRGGVEAGFTFRDNAQAVTFRLASNRDPLELIEQRGELRRLPATWGARCHSAARRGALTNHSEDGRARETLETVAPVLDVLAGLRLREERGKIGGIGERDAVFAEEGEGDFSGRYGCRSCCGMCWKRRRRTNRRGTDRHGENLAAGVSFACS